MISTCFLYTSGVFLGLLTFILGIVIIVFAFLLLFHIQKIEVKGNKYCTENDVIGWLREDKYAVNSVYVWWKYNKADVKQLPVVESVSYTHLQMAESIGIKDFTRYQHIFGFGEYTGIDLPGEASTSPLVYTEETMGCLLYTSEKPAACSRKDVSRGFRR